MCLKFVSKAHIESAKVLSQKANSELEKVQNGSKLPFSPNHIEQSMFLNVCARRHDKVMTMAETLQKAPNSVIYRTGTIYILLLQLIFMKKDSSQAMLALTLYNELFNGGTTISPEETRLATELMLSVFENCSDFTLLLPLKAVYESTVLNVVGSEYEAKYIGAALHVLINSQQYNRTLELFERYVTTLDPNDTVATLLQLPVTQLLDFMAKVQDCDSIYRWLRMFSAEDITIAPQQWNNMLGVALSLNHYNLVLLIYERWIMAGLDTQISVENVILSHKFTQLRDLNSALNTLADTTLYQVLHTFASHGDVDLTLNLIEWHYIHKTLKGEKALTKELCVDIIRSYCFNNQSNIEGDIDRSIERVLDVVESFMSRKDANIQLSYKDISDAFSHKIHTLNIKDKNVVKAIVKQQGIVEAIEDACENTEAELPRKSVGGKWSSSLYGNPLGNLDTLKEFTLEHIDYLKSSSASIFTIQIFVNCLLSHINKYQNFTGMVSLLVELKRKNKAFLDEWITKDLIDILVHCLSQSPAARLTGLELYKYFSEKGPIAQHNMVSFIFSSLHKADSYALVEYYIYQYLSMTLTTISSELTERISKFTYLGGRGKVMLQFLKEHQYLPPSKEQLDRFWANNALNSSDKIDAEDSSKYHNIDVRDCENLHSVLFSENSSPAFP